MGLFNKNADPNAAKPVKTPETTFAAARSNLLMVVAFTAVNLILTLVNADLYFLFSATVPQFILGIGYAFENTTALAVCAVIAFLGAGVYLLCWWLSKKHRGWMVVALILFALDTLASLGMLLLDGTMFIDLLFHVWVLYYLISGTVAMVKMKNQPEQPEMPVYAEGAPEQPAEFAPPAEPVFEAPAEPVYAEPAAEPVAPAAAPAPVMVNGEPVNE